MTKRYIPNPDQQPDLIAEASAEYTITPEQEAEKERYRERLRLHLKDPAFRQIEGFPLGEDDAILALSDPPYYTACPNPFLGEIIEKWQAERAALRKEMGLPVGSALAADEAAEGYQREPFAADVSEGKNDPIYNAHSYHTKVPHKAIMRYILHYTDPGDIVLDGFCGTGMTGVAAQLCGDKKTVESLGYTVDKKGYVVASPGDEQPISRLGARKAVLVDLSPAATFIAYNYNTPVDAKAFEREARRIIKEVEEECGWMYETWHPHCDDPKRVKGKINYMIWSDILTCPQCNTEMVFWNVAMDRVKGNVRESWECPNCGTRLAKSPARDGGLLKAERSLLTSFDPDLGQVTRHVKQAPVLINYSVGKERCEKHPDKEDLALVGKIETSHSTYPFPIFPMMLIGEEWGDTWRAGVHAGITHTHHFYTPRNLILLSTIWSKIRAADEKQKRILYFLCQSLAMGYTKLNRYGATHFSQVNRNLSGTLYVSSLTTEVSLQYAFAGKLSRLYKAFNSLHLDSRSACVSTQSASEGRLILDNTVDYIFIDPPFGSNLMYSELNFLWEVWLGVITSTNTEAIMNVKQHKGLPEYQFLMESCFVNFICFLKPGHWMTVEFHNSQNAIWNAIQEAILRAGFMIADVRTLDKQGGTFKQITSTAAVKQDLIISAYKPRAEFEQRFLAEGGSVQGAWDFIRQHLEQLPIPALDDGVMETLAERQGYLLYDRMVAFHIQRGLSVPLSAAEFYAGLPQRFLDRDGMYFTPSQAAEYDKRRLGAQKVEQLALFVSDEKSALQWLRQELNPESGGGPQTYQDLQPKFIRELHQARHEALPELRTILEQNFLQDAQERWYVPNPERQADLDALRQKTLLREFAEYCLGKGKLKVFRSEAVRAGFHQAWDVRDFTTILKVAERLPESVLQENQQLLMYVHNAQLLAEKGPRQERLF
ncbi:MAG: hypothetical protein JXB15_01065 [Anaerolineales bacterium]|nr:hypothetical protein [Anaerolineales bacterium]